MNVLCRSTITYCPGVKKYYWNLMNKIGGYCTRKRDCKRAMARSFAKWKQGWNGNKFYVNDEVVAEILPACGGKRVLMIHEQNQGYIDSVNEAKTFVHDYFNHVTQMAGTF